MAILSILLTVVLIAVSVLIVLIVLIQRPKQEGLGAAFGGSTLDSALGAHTTDVLQKITTYLGIIFFVTAIGLAMLKTRQFRASAANDVLEKVEEREPAAPQIPASISDLPVNLDSMPETETPGTNFDLKGLDSPTEPAQKEGEKANTGEKPAEPAKKETTPDAPKKKTAEKAKEAPKEPAKSADESKKKEGAKSSDGKGADSKGESGN